VTGRLLVRFVVGVWRAKEDRMRPSAARFGPDARSYQGTALGAIKKVILSLFELARLFVRFDHVARSNRKPESAHHVSGRKTQAPKRTSGRE